MTDITRKQFLDFVNVADDITTKVNGNFTVSYYDDFTQKDFDELENKLLELVKEKEEKDKQLLTLEWVIGVLSCLVLFIPIIIGALAPIAQEWVRLIIVFSGFLPCFAGFFFALKIEQVAGYYECRECGHRYVPTFKAVNLAPHMGRTRKMKCPKCGKKSWQKKVLSKDS